MALPITQISWADLVLAGLFEVVWPVGLKISQTPEKMVIGIVLAIFCVLLSGGFLWLAQKTIPIGTAYAVWTGIGAAGTFVLGVILYGDSASLLRLLGVVLIICGVISLKLAS